MSVEVSKLSKQYGEQKAVNNASFAINTGEVVGFLGPNGAGKSTTMKTLTSFVAPTSGTAKVAGFDIIENPLSVRKNVGYLPENNPLYFDMYVKEYLNFTANVFKIKNKKSRIEEMIELTGLQKEQKKKIGQLSKGYKQRVGLAQAMLHDPKVLILDEPTSGLDPNQLVDIRKLITDLGKEKTVLLSTHIMQEVEAMCSRVIIINNGNIVANNSVNKIQQIRKNKQQVLFKTKKPLKSFNNVEISKADNGFYRASTSTKIDIRELLFHKCVEENNVIFHLEEEVNSLESIFKDLTK